jgi:hypothetical protein
MSAAPTNPNGPGYLGKADQRRSLIRVLGDRGSDLLATLSAGFVGALAWMHVLTIAQPAPRVLARASANPGDDTGEGQIREEVLAATAAYTDATGAPTGYELWWPANIRRASIHRVARTRPGRLDWRPFPATGAETRTVVGEFGSPMSLRRWLGARRRYRPAGLWRGMVAVGDQVMPSVRGRLFTDLPMCGHRGLRSSSGGMRTSRKC